MNKELQYLVYNTPEGSVSVSAIVNDETIWLTQKAMAELFGVEVPAISKHLANIYSEGELQPEARGCLKSWLLFRHPREFKIKSLYSNDLILNIASKSKETVQKLKFLDSPFKPKVTAMLSVWSISTTLIPLSRLATVSIHAKQLSSGFGQQGF